jgi:hypothetical protein
MCPLRSIVDEPATMFPDMLRPVRFPTLVKFEFTMPDPSVVLDKTSIFPNWYVFPPNTLTVPVVKLASVPTLVREELTTPLPNPVAPSTIKLAIL